MKTPIIEPATQTEGTATLVHCTILRNRATNRYCNLFIVMVDFPGRGIRYHLMRNTGDQGLSMSYIEPLAGDVVLSHTEDSYEHIKLPHDLEVREQIKHGYSFWSEYNSRAENPVPVRLLATLGLRLYDPELFRLCGNELKVVTTVVSTLTKKAVRELGAYRSPIYSGVTMVTSDDSAGVTLEQRDHSLAAAITTRRRLEQLLVDINTVQANAEGQFEALNYLLTQELGKEEE